MIKNGSFLKHFAWVLTLIGAGIGFYFGRLTAPPTIQKVKIVDTLILRDTVFLSWGASLGAYRCDSVKFEGKGVFTYGEILRKGSELYIRGSEWPHWTIWGGLGYTYRLGVQPYIGIFWWRSSYMGIGAYVVPVHPYAIGVGVGVRF